MHLRNEAIRMACGNQCRPNQLELTTAETLTALINKEMNFFKDLKFLIAIDFFVR